MTPEHLKKRLARLYGASLSDRQLCLAIARDMGLASDDTVRKWLNGVNPVPPYMSLIFEALKARALKENYRGGRAVGDLWSAT